MDKINYNELCLHMTTEEYEKTDFCELTKASIKEALRLDGETVNYRYFKVTLEDGEVKIFRVGIAPDALRFEGVKCFKGNGGILYPC